MYYILLLYSNSIYCPDFDTFHNISYSMATCEPVFGVAPVALHPGERQRGQVVAAPVPRLPRGVPAAQGPVRGDPDDPSGAHVSPVRIHAHVHVISPAEGGHPARAAGAIVSGVAVRVTAAAASAVHAAARAAVVRPVSVVWLVHPRAHHAALLHVAEDLVDAEADGLHVRVLLQMRPQYPYVVHGLPRDPPPPPQLRREEQRSLHAPHPWTL